MGAIYIIWLRNMKRYFRSKSRMIGSLVQPLLLLLILGFGIISIGPSSSYEGVSYLKFIIPGVVAMTVLITSIYSGIQIIWDKQFGFLKETLITPVSRISIMMGQTLGGASSALIQGLILFTIAFLVGRLTFHTGILIALMFMFLVGISFTALGIAIASRMKDMQGFQLIINFLIAPLFLLSGALFPLTDAHYILKKIFYFNPLSYGVEGIRYGILGTSVINPLLCLAVISGFGLIAILIGGYSFRRMKF